MAEFTPSEIALFLGQQDQLPFSKEQQDQQPIFQGQEEQLPASPPRTISVVPRGQNTAVSLTKSAFQAYFNVEYCTHLRFPSLAVFRQVLRDCPWLLNKSFLGEENRLQAQQLETELRKGQVANCYVKWVDNHVGHGLFAAADLPPNTFVGEFTGLVRRLYRLNPDHNAYCFHYPTRLFSWHYTLIDAKAYGNETRFINHSQTPNLTPLAVCERNLLHIVFMTNAPIKADTQLTYNYGSDFWLRRKENQSLK